ncbi:MAG: hypothetical protein ACE5I3_04565 [Phycisphaerae bacterium]
MLGTQRKGLLVGADKRNTRIVASLVAAMTLGAAILLWLEPLTPGWSSATLLMAESARPIKDLRIEYTAPNAAGDLAAYDCVVWPSGECAWRPSGPRIRLAVVSSQGKRLPQAQAQTLLAVFGSMTQRHGLELERVWLHPTSDARLHPELPAQAHDLCDLLVRKGIVP